MGQLVPAFNAEACELANLLVRVSQLCQRPEPTNCQRNSTGPCSSSIEDTFWIKITIDLGRQFV